MGKLSKQLGLVHLFCITCGAMISSGIFILPGLAHAMAGPAVILSYTIAGLLALCGLLSIAELITAMPKAGGDYFYISRGIGPGAGTIAGLLSWFSLSLKSAFALIGLALLLDPFVPVSWHVLALGWCAVFTLVNLKGTKEAANLQVGLVTVLLLIMIGYIARGTGNINVGYFEPFAPQGLKGVFATAGFVFVSYGGLIQVASLAGEIRSPGKNIPVGMIISLVFMIAVYGLMVFVTSGVLGPEKLDNSLTPISDAAEVIAGRFGYATVSVAAALAFLTTANAGILTASRYLLALSRDQLLPAPLSKISRFYTPHVSVLVTGIVIGVVVFLKLRILVEAASIVFILSYALASLSVIVIRQSRVQNYRPLFRAPFYPWLQLFTIIGAMFVLLEMGEEAFLITIILVVTGFCFYWFYGRKRTEQESALLHLIESVLDRELVTGRLESELKDVVRERDLVKADRFDELIEECRVFDIEKPTKSKSLYEMAGKHLSDKFGMDSEEIVSKLIEKEKECTPVISKNTAIPHAIVKDDGIFHVIMARCREGVEFEGTNSRPEIIFVLIFSRDQRNLYLKVLAAIARIMQTPEIEKKWLKVKGERGLKDLVLLIKRRRFT